jgi:hypothetical protein
MSYYKGDTHYKYHAMASQNKNGKKIYSKQIAMASQDKERKKCIVALKWFVKTLQFLHCTFITIIEFTYIIKWIFYKKRF